MQDNFYTINGSPDNYPKFNYKKKWILLVAIGALLTIGALIYLFVGRDESVEVLRQVEEICNGNFDEASCRRDNVIISALNNSNPGICAALSGTDFEICVNELALRDDDLNTCNLIFGEGRKSCKDGLWIRRAITDLNFDFCRNISDEVTRVGCGNTLVARLIPISGCDFQNEWTEYCNELILRMNILNSAETLQDCAPFLNSELNEEVDDLYLDCISRLAPSEIEN
jgi:hypothetical protein